jgi:hypothetical protein
VDGQLIVLFGVGERPGFYRRLDRLRGTHKLSGTNPSESS